METELIKAGIKGWVVLMDEEDSDGGRGQLYFNKGDKNFYDIQSVKHAEGIKGGRKRTRRRRKKSKKTRRRTIKTRKKRSKKHRKTRRKTTRKKY